MKNFQKVGGFSAFYMGVSYIVGIIIFLVVLDYPSIESSEDKMIFIKDNHSMMFLTNLLLFVYFGIFLCIFTLALYERLKIDDPLTIQLATLLGIIWAIVLIASGVISNACMEPAIDLYKTDPNQATLFWLKIETISGALGGSNGEFLGGLFTIFVSLSVYKGARLPKGLSYFGFFIGTVGLISTIPGLEDLGGVFGITQIIWFFWFGKIMFNDDLN